MGSGSYVGIDFGTTNSAVAIANDAGDVRLVPLAGASMWRTVLFFEQNGQLSAGAAAIKRYLETSGDGRLVQSIKSHLASSTFTKTQILGRRWQLDDMIAAFLRQVRAAADTDLGSRCVVGRPVKYWGAETAEDDARAVARMKEALAKAGFDEVVFEHEPVGAAARYAASLDHDELIVVADFGGGTSDFSVIRVGPRANQVLANGGIGVSGDAFDARVIDHVVAPALGRGSRFRDEFGATTPVPAWLYSHVRRWHLLSFLKEDSTQRLLARILDGATDRNAIERLVTLIDEDLGMPLHRAVEGAKVTLSKAASARVELPQIELALGATREGFDAWIAEDLDLIDTTLETTLAQAGIEAKAIDRVFATGGSSLVPAVRDRLAARFGADKLQGGDELTSVAWGLARRARDHFAT